MEDQLVIAKSDFTFEVEILGNPLPDVQWFKDDKLIVQDDKYQICSSNNLYRIVIKDATLEDSGYYKIVATNSIGSDSVTAKAQVLGNDNSRSD